MTSFGPVPAELCVLVSDRDPAVRLLLERMLARNGHGVVTAADPRTVANDGSLEGVDIAILEVGGDLGLRPLQAVRAAGPLAPLWVLTVLPPGEEEDVAVALEEGADDCMVKPLSPRELLSRVRAMARRVERPTTVLEFAGLTIDLRARAVTAGHRLVALPPREFDLLVFLASHPNEVISRGRLLNEIWGASARWQPGDTLTEHVHRLRRRLEEQPTRPRWLRTVRGVGYLFDAEARGR
jgi:two-component system alkaline phosphatase synthesis response regulator PhoP